MDRTGCSALPQAAKDSDQLVLWEIGRQEVTVDFTAQDVVTDTGLLLARELDLQLGALAEAASRLDDPRSQQHVTHDPDQLLVQGASIGAGPR